MLRNIVGYVENIVSHFFKKTSTTAQLKVNIVTPSKMEMQPDSIQPKPLTVQKTLTGLPLPPAKEENLQVLLNTLSELMKREESEIEGWEEIADANETVEELAEKESVTQEKSIFRKIYDDIKPYFEPANQQVEEREKKLEQYLVFLMADFKQNCSNFKKLNEAKGDTLLAKKKLVKQICRDVIDILKMYKQFLEDLKKEINYCVNAEKVCLYILDFLLTKFNIELPFVIKNMDFTSKYQSFLYDEIEDDVKEFFLGFNRFLKKIDAEKMYLEINQPSELAKETVVSLGDDVSKKIKEKTESKPIINHHASSWTPLQFAALKNVPETQQNSHKKHFSF